MPGLVSSAEPEALFRYADRANGLDQELAHLSQQLAATLQHFGATCVEYRIQVGGMADTLRSLAREAEGLDQWVHQVGQAFQRADGLWWAGAVQAASLVRSFPLLRLPWPSTVIVRLPRVKVPDWLLAKLKPYTLSPSTPQDATASPAPKRQTFGDLLREGEEARRQNLTTLYPPGMSPVPGVVTSAGSALPVHPERTSTLTDRDPALYAAVINQFGVESNSRYQKRWIQKTQKWDTYCNIFAWDVTSAMGAEIPHWLDKDWRAVHYTGKQEPGWNEANVAKMRKWLQSGYNAKWRPASAEKAQQWANSGKPSVVLDTAGSHIGVIRPGEIDPQKGPALAQAGKDNFAARHVDDGFYGLSVEYWIAD